MIKVNTMIAICAALSLSAQGGVEGLVVPATQATPVAQVNAGYASDNVWRGTNLGDHEGEVEVSTQINLPSEIQLDITALQSLTDSSANSVEDETKTSFGLSKSLNDWLLGLSYIWYSVDFNKTDRSSAQEIGLSVARELSLREGLNPLLVSYTQFVGVEGDNGGYSELAALYSDDFGSGFEFDFKGTLGYLSQDSEFTHFELRASTDFVVTSEVTASPFVAYNIELDNPAGLGADDSNYFFGGIQFKKGF
jgi:hypothetical protein